MNAITKIRYAILLAAVCLFVTASCSHALRLGDIKLPPGFSIDIYCDDVPGARSMALGDDGTLYVGTRDEAVFAVVDNDGDMRADRVYTLAGGLNMPNGVAYREGSLYVAEVHRVIRFDKVEENLDAPPEPVVVNDSFPAESHHGWKFIRFGPDGYLYVPVGAPCNICEPGDPYASILRMKPDGSGLEVFARGIRNTVGFDWRPGTDELWFTDNGRDWMGDDIPSDELNRADKSGMHFGYPYFHAGDIPDPEFGEGRRSGEFTPPEAWLGAHVASLGMRFYTGDMFPAKYRGGMFIAEHGSWNRSIPVGYRVVFVPVEGGRAAGQEVFAEGWKAGMNGWGRPVDVQVMSDGSLLVSDDRQGVIYRITYNPG